MYLPTTHVFLSVFPSRFPTHCSLAEIDSADQRWYGYSGNSLHGSDSILDSFLRKVYWLVCTRLGAGVSSGSVYMDTVV